MDEFRELLKAKPYAVPDNELFTRLLRQSLEIHQAKCLPYQRLLQKRNFDPSKSFQITDVPPIPVQLFKKIDLRSIADDEVVKVLQSSATSSQTPSKVFLDNETRTRQTQVLLWLLGDLLGNVRRPFFICDADPGQGASNDSALPARSAAIRGFLAAASKAKYLLKASSSGRLMLDPEAYEEFIAAQDKRPVLFGFTYVLFVHVLPQLERTPLKARAINTDLVHIGGWKKLQSKAVSKEVFNRAMTQVIGIPPGRTTDIYGFTEQLGIIYPDLDGVKRCSGVSRLIVRNPKTLDPVPDGTEGLLNFITPLPIGYPGNSILLDDVGTIISREPDSQDRHGTAFVVAGRAKGSEVRGCGDILGLKLEGAR